MADSPQMEDEDEDNPDDLELKEMSHEDLIAQINQQVLNNKK
ncbi:MAG: hypothetical protein ACRC0E_09920 [Soonwooa sp.]